MAKVIRRMPCGWFTAGGTPSVTSTSISTPNGRTMSAASWGSRFLACCQPEAYSPVKVTVASWVPLLDHSLPTWVPVLVLLL